MTAIIYVRVSSGEQVLGTSLDVQERQCRRYCAENGLVVLAVFREEGESAKSADRTELLRALAYCRDRSNRAKAFIVAKVDRFARNTEDHFHVRSLLQKAGVTLHSVSERIGNAPNEKFVETIMAATAELDNAVRARRCIDGMQGRLRNGINPWKPPIGYLCARHRAKDEKKRTPDAADPNTFPIIQRGLRAYLGGEVRTITGLAAALDRWGLSAYTGKRTTKQVADAMLGRYLNFYCGILVDPWDRSQHPGSHHPMITPAEGAQIRLVRAGRLKPWARKKDRYNPAFPLRQSVRCGACGRFVTGGLSKGRSKRYAYYFCANRACAARGKSISRDVLHQAFERTLGGIVPDLNYWKVLARLLVKSVASIAATARQDSLQRSQAIAELQAKRRRIFEMSENGTYTKEMFRERVEEVEAQLSSLSEDEVEPLPSTADIESLTRAAHDYYARLITLWRVLFPRGRGRFEQLIFPEGVFLDLPCTVRTTVLAPTLAIFSAYDTLNPFKVDLDRHSLNQVLRDLVEIAATEKELRDAFAELMLETYMIERAMPTDNKPADENPVVDP